MLEDHSITAEFELDEYELNLNVEGEGSTEQGEGSYTYDHGEEVTVEAVPEDGWVFSHWSGDVTEEEEEITIIIDGDKDITAHFVEEAYFEVEVTTPEEEFEKG